MSGTFTTDTAGPTAVTLLDRDHFARLLLIFKAQLLKQGSGSVEPGQLAFGAHNCRANSHDLFIKIPNFRKRKKIQFLRWYYVLMSRFLVGFAAARRFRAAADDNCRSCCSDRDGRSGGRQGDGSSRNLFFRPILEEMGQLRYFGSDNNLGGPQLLPVFAVGMLAEGPALRVFSMKETQVQLATKQNQTELIGAPLPTRAIHNAFLLH